MAKALVVMWSLPRAGLTMRPVAVFAFPAGRAPLLQAETSSCALLMVWVPAQVAALSCRPAWLHKVTRVRSRWNLEARSLAALVMWLCVQGRALARMEPVATLWCRRELASAAAPRAGLCRSRAVRPLLGPAATSA